MTPGSGLLGGAGRASVTLLIFAVAIFALMELAPGDPMAQVPLSVPDEVKQEMRRALGLGEPAYVRFGLWLWQLCVIEPLTGLDALLGTQLAGGQSRILSWQARAPVMQIVASHLPQTLWVVGLAYVVGVAIALPLGICQAWRQHSVFDRAGTAVTMLAYSVPPFLSGVVLIAVFSVWLGWLPSIYDTTHRVEDWSDLWVQARQMILPVAVLSIQTTALIARYTRAAVLENLRMDHVRTARSKGLSEASVLARHVLRQSMIPVVTVIALGLPQVFGGAVVTEQIFLVNGLGHLLISSIEANDLPVVRTVTFLMAVLIVLANLAADVTCRLLDPRIGAHD